MKRYQKIIIVMGASVIILMLMFPPFHVIFTPGIEINMGYAFILNPPKFWGQVESVVNLGRLMVQVGWTALLFTVVYLMVHSYKKR
ncbi:MAG TPA: hypothetical protein PLR71_13250 [Deltaproteobacteria bacterium]|nr:hypothetical protein [Deltaproteobacteria bacterium]